MRHQNKLTSSLTGVFVLHVHVIQAVDIRVLCAEVTAYCFLFLIEYKCFERL